MSFGPLKVTDVVTQNVSSLDHNVTIVFFTVILMDTSKSVKNFFFTHSQLKPEQLDYKPVSILE